MGLCQYVDLCFHALSLPCLHTFWHAIPTSFIHFLIYLWMQNMWQEERILGLRKYHSMHIVGGQTLQCLTTQFTGFTYLASPSFHYIPKFPKHGVYKFASLVDLVMHVLDKDLQWERLYTGLRDWAACTLKVDRCHMPNCPVYISSHAPSHFTPLQTVVHKWQDRADNV